MEAPEEEDDGELLKVGWNAPKHPNGEQAGPFAWYVRVWFPHCCGAHRRLIMCGFARERDAELGKAALLNAGLDTVEKLLENKPRLREIMCSALQW